MKFLRLTLFLLIIILGENVFSQELSRLRFKTLPVNGDTLQLDTLSIVENSLVIRAPDDAFIDSSQYHLDLINGFLVWDSVLAFDSVAVVYRTFPFRFSKVIFRKDPAAIELTEDFVLNPFSYIPPSEQGSFVDFGTLEYNGSFARGISFGNNQDVVLNSSFNLQLSGYITKDVEVVAALTDNNVPIQPDGTTQQLQEFDKVFIKINKEPHSLIMGDYEIGNPDGYFMRYFKKLQGGSYAGWFDISENERVKLQASAAVAKGKFNRYQLPVTEGNQGPYKLRGESGETFIIVLAGTERVFINGKLMVRGSENDYIIDYNLGEITFTPNVLITGDLRVVVEFEYSERSYFRSTLAASAAYERKKIKFQVNFFTEQDSKNQPVDAELTDEQKQALRGAGDDPIGTLFRGYQPVDFDKTRILYEIFDTDSSTPQIDTAFVFAQDTSAETQYYQVFFTFVGAGLGDYNPAASTANGRVFQYVPRRNEIPQGSYIPYRILVTPKRQQMVSAFMQWEPSENDSIVVEGALSNNDLNTFSDRDDADNAGVATKTNYTRRFKIGEKSKEQFLLANVNYEFVNHNFRELERFRPVEFNRDWNYERTDTVDEHLAEAGLVFSKELWLNTGYRFSTFIANDNYFGTQQRLISTIDKKGYFLNADIRYLNSESDFVKSNFIRPTIEVAKSFSKLRGWKIGSRYQQENNKIKDKTTDVLQPNSFVYNDWMFYITNADTSQDKIRLEYIRRLEFFPRNDSLRLSNASNTITFKGNFITNPTHKLGWQLTYRRFESKDTVLALREPEHYYLGRIDYGLTVLKGAITTNVLYQLGAGREPRITYTYLQVEDGEGNFVWKPDINDYNGNGLADVNEFELAPFTDVGNYIRVLNPTNEYDAVDITEYNHVLNLNPRAVWNNQQDIKGFVARFSTTTSLQVSRKIFRGSGKSLFNPFVFDEEESSLVSLNNMVRNSIFFNRQSAVYSLEYTVQDNRRKFNQVNGVETNALREHIARLRWNISQPVNLIVAYTSGKRENRSELFSERDYLIRSQEVEPQFSYLYGTKLRLTMLYRFDYRKNTIGEDAENALSNEASIEGRYNVVSTSTLTAKFSFVKIDYTGSENSAIEFAMLQGFKDGNNYTWSAAFERSLATAVQLSLVYDGRKTGDSKPVHVGRIQVRAIF